MQESRHFACCINFLLTGTSRVRVDMARGGNGGVRGSDLEPRAKARSGAFVGLSDSGPMARLSSRQHSGFKTPLRGDFHHRLLMLLRAPGMSCAQRNSKSLET